MRAENTRDKYRKNNKFNKILDLEKEETKKGPETSANIAKIAKVTRIFLANRKNRKNSKSNKNQDLEKVEAKKGLEMSSNVAKNANWK